MHLKKLLLISIILMGLKTSAKETKEERFWNWFTEHQQSYYEDADNYEKQDRLFDELSKELKKVHKDLVFEFSPIHENGVREFSISADGIKSVFPAVESLVKKAPQINKWQINAFRQRVPGDNGAIQYGDIEIEYDDIYFRFADGKYGELGIELNIRDFKDDGYFQGAVYILLDALLGEYDVTMAIKWIEWVELKEENIEESMPLIELRSLIDQKK